MNNNILKLFNFISSSLTVINYILYSISKRLNLNFLIPLTLVLIISNILLNLVLMYKSKKQNILKGNILYNFIFTLILNFGLLILWLDLI